MKPTDFLTLEEARTAPRVIKSMINGKSMMIYLKGFKLFLHCHEIAEGKHDNEIDGVLTNHPAKETCLLLVESLRTLTNDGEDFNFIVGHNKGDLVIGEFEQLAVDIPEKHDEILALVELCKSLCNVTTYPLAELSQEAFDKAHADLALYVDTASTKTGYPRLDGSQSWHVHANRSPVRFTVRRSEEAPVDIRIPVYMATRNDSDDDFVFDESQPVGHVTIKAGTKAGAFTKKVTSDLTRHTQFKTISPISGTYTLEVAAA